MPHAASFPVTFPHNVLFWGFAVHVLIAGLYAVIIWLSAMAYCIIVGASLWRFLVLSPFFISGAILAILVLDLGVTAVRWLWRNRATLRIWRVQAGEQQQADPQQP